MSPRRVVAKRARGLPSTVRRGLEFRAWHFHGCTECGAFYSDGCDIPLANGRCHEHRSAPRPRPAWDSFHDPLPCCATDSQVADNGVREARSLAGPGPWWVCRTCKHAIPYDPAQPATGAPA